MQNKKEFVKSKQRIQRNLIYEEIRKTMEEQGYTTWRVFGNRFTVYRMLLIAVNQLAAVTGREPIRVYQTIKVILMRVLRGSRFRPGRLAKPDLNALRGWEEEGKEIVICPNCGQNLLDQGPVSKQELLQTINQNFKARHPIASHAVGGELKNTENMKKCCKNDAIIQENIP